MSLAKTGGTGKSGFAAVAVLIAARAIICAPMVIRYSPHSFHRWGGFDTNYWALEFALQAIGLIAISLMSAKRKLSQFLGLALILLNLATLAFVIMVLLTAMREPTV